MKQRFNAIFILTGMLLVLLLTACNATEQPEISMSNENSEAGITDTVFSQEESDTENSEAIKDMSKATDDNMNKKYKLSVDNFKFTDINYKSTTGYVIKYEYSDAHEKKADIAAQRIVKSVQGKDISLSFAKTYSYPTLLDCYSDGNNQNIEYIFDNYTGKYIGFRKKDVTVCESTIIKEPDEFKKIAIETLEAIAPIDDYEISNEFYEPFIEPDNMPIAEKFNPYRYPDSEILMYHITYRKKINGIFTSECVMCNVYADGVVTYEIYNQGMFDNVVVPEVDLNEVMMLATDKAADVLDSIPDTYELKSVELKNYRYNIDSTGKVTLSFHFSYRAQPKEELNDGKFRVPLYDGCNMIIVFD